jgi:hypothetical protein
MNVKHVLSFEAEARAVAFGAAHDRPQAMRRIMGKTTGSFSAADFLEENRAKALTSLGRKRPAILPHDRSAVGLAKPAHPGPPVFPSRGAAQLENLLGIFVPK